MVIKLVPEGMWKIIILTSKIAQSIQVTFFNAALHTLYNSCKQLTETLADVLAKNRGL